jgi:hypothetical protein
MNHVAGKVSVGAQENLMKARDERIALMNEILGAIRMVKVRSSFLHTVPSVMLVDLSSWPGNAASKNESSLSETESSSINN